MNWQPKTAGLLLSLLLASCSSNKEDAKKEEEPVRPVELTEVKRDSIDRIIAVDGVLRALNQSGVTSKISAPVKRFLVTRGDHVRQGQLIAELENRDLAAAVTDAKGAVEQAEATLRNVSNASVPDELSKAQADVTAARQAMDAAQKLVESRTQLLQQGAIARRLVDEAGVAYAQAKSQFDTAQTHLTSVQAVGRVENVKVVAAQLDSAKGKLEAAQAQLSYAQIYSPISGVVAERPVFEGELAVPGMPLMTILDISSVIARVNVPQAQAGYVKVGQAARIISVDGIEAAGKVTIVSPAVDPQGTTLEVWVQAANPGEKLRPGGTVHVTVNAETVRNAVVVPPAALLPSSEGGTSVFVVGQDMVAHEHKVQVGIRTPEQAQVLTGLDAGTRVIVAGGLGLQDGAKVKLAEAEKKEDDKEEKGSKGGEKEK
ncbi:MAG: efflux RND transporter periplasmic adaptor subunit [Acidobacteriia bacterium]|nr:efflux RND transporter periplasmic adaptor subunit [Terriglobia bacterium]